MYLRKITAAALAVIAACMLPLTAAQITAAEKPVQNADGTVNIVRLGGADRFETAGIIAGEGWDKASAAVLANAYTYADALAGAPLAYAYDAPILLTKKDALPQSVKDELIKLGVKEVILLGGTAAIGSAVEAELINSGYAVERIYGATRYDTAAAIADALKKKAGSPKEVFVASGENYPDALAASPAAAIKKCPILYVPSKGSAARQTTDFISSNRIENVYVLGGMSAISSETFNDLGNTVDTDNTECHRIAGTDRYETAALIAKIFDGVFTGGGAAFATGKNFPDALAGSVSSAKKGIPVLLTDNAGTCFDMKQYLLGKSIRKAYAFGDSKVVSDRIIMEYTSASAASSYEWILKPSVQADDINVITCTFPFGDSGSLSYYDYNTQEMHLYDSLSIIKRDGYLGLIDYGGKLVTDTKYTEITAASGRRYLLCFDYYTGSGDEDVNMADTLDKSRNIRRVSDKGPDNDYLSVAGEVPGYEFIYADGAGLFYYSAQDGSYHAWNGIWVSPLMSAIYADKSAVSYNYTDGGGGEGKQISIALDKKNCRRILLKNGVPVSDALYEDAGCFADGIIPVKKDGKWGYVDTNGNTVIPFEYEPCWEAVTRTGFYGYYDQETDTYYADNTLPRAYNSSDGYVAVSKDGQAALYDCKGRTVIGFGVFERIRPVYEGRCWVMKDGLWGVIELK